MIANVTIHNAMGSLPWQELHNLREQGLAEAHGGSPVVKSRTLSADTFAQPCPWLSQGALLAQTVHQGPDLGLRC